MRFKTINVRWSPSLSVAFFVYETTHADSPFRKLMVAWHVWNSNWICIKEPGTKQALIDNPEYAADLAIALTGKLEGDPDPFSSSKLEYQVKDAAQRGADCASEM